MAFIEGLFCTQNINCSFGTWVLGRFTEVAFIQGWPLRGVSLTSNIIQLPLLYYCKTCRKALASAPA